MSFNLENLIRKNILNVKPYASARDEFSGEAKTFLDANENGLGSPLMKFYNRYPDPHQQKLKESISNIKSVSADQIFLGNGSDECIDLLYRCFCEPGEDNVIICPPTYGMYEVSGVINDVQINAVPLLPDFSLDLDAILNTVNSQTKIIWLCSPNNPTGNSLSHLQMETLLNNFEGLVVVDEAYINFSRQRSLIPDLENYPNLVILQTFSKAWGLAGLRLGLCIASAEIINWLNKIKPPYNINQVTQELALNALEELGQVKDMVQEIVSMREALSGVFQQMPVVKKVYPSDANFLLVQFDNAKEIYKYLLDESIVVRDRSQVILCENCLRITIGSERENTSLVDALIKYMEEVKK